MSTGNAYNCFPNFVFRCPLLPTNSAEHDFHNSPLIQESIFLASPDLYNALKSAYTTTNHLNDKIDLKLKLALLKYFSRMTHRCTPFGIFAGCGVGQFDKESVIILDDLNSFSTTTRLDMDYLCALADALTKHPQIVDKLHFYPNSSLYPLFQTYRYIEHAFIKGKKKYYLTEIESNEILADIVTLTQTGLLKTDIVNHLVSKDIERGVAEAFINDLIQSQILVSNLAPGVTGNDALDEITHTLTQLNIPGQISTALLSIKDQLNIIDKNKPGRKEELYKVIEQEVHKLGIKHDRKFLFQSDMSVKPIKATLSEHISNLAQKGLQVLNRLTPYTETRLLKKFKEDFYKRYEDEEVPLPEVLDTDIGIGFNKLLPGKTDIHPLIDNIPQALNRSPKDTPPTAQEVFMLEKYSACIRNGDTEVRLSDEDLQYFPESWNDLPTTLSSVIEVLQDTYQNDSSLHITMRSASGPSGASLLSRFSHTNPQLKKHLLHITEKEQTSLKEDEIIAEVCHLPEARTGNILFRPTLRKYEIPFLAKGSVSREFQIPISDLLVSVKGGGHINLRSKRLNKKIIPVLTSAHNFSYNSLPIYHFLCCLQTDRVRTTLQFNWGKLVGNRSFYPRVSYQNIILAPVTWNVNRKILKNIPSVTSNNFMEQIQRFRDENKIPGKVLLVNGDNKLYIDLTDELSAQLLITETKGQDFQLEEYLFDDSQSCIRGNNASYNNQVIVSFYKNDAGT